MCGKVKRVNRPQNTNQTTTKMKTKIGQRFETISGEQYILAQTSSHVVSLINLDNGNRFSGSGVEVKNCDDISVEEWEAIIGFESFVRCL